jgi:hypothetical protein
MKIIFSLILLVSTCFCFGQNELLNDWELKELKGKVRRLITQTSSHDSNNQPTKYISNFDENGFLTKTTEYNTYYVEDDSVALSSIITYKNTVKKRYFYRYHIEKKDTTMTGYYEKVGKNKYLTHINYKSRYTTNKYELIENGKIIRDHYIAYDYDEKKITDVIWNYNYNKDELLEINIVDNLKDTQETKKLDVESIKDEYGNIINQIYFEQDGKIALEIKNKIYYYD